MIALVESGGARTLVTVPMLKEGDLVGTIALYRRKVSPVHRKQIGSSKLRGPGGDCHREYAPAQRDLRQRTTDLGEALEQQRATAEILASFRAYRRMCSRYSIPLCAISSRSAAA